VHAVHDPKRAAGHRRRTQEASGKEKKSLNRVVVETLALVTGTSHPGPPYRDLDATFRDRRPDPELDAMLEWMHNAPIHDPPGGLRTIPITD
jgi:hypothetical protein